MAFVQKTEKDAHQPVSFGGKTEFQIHNNNI